MDKELMKLNIQLFAEEADNADDEFEDEVDYETTDEVEDEDVSDTDDADGEEDEIEDASEKTKNSTKEYSERLNRERENIRKEVEKAQNDKLDAIAKKRGFDSWEDLEKYDEKQRLESFGIEDTDEFSTYLNEIIEKNPKIQEANAIILAQKEVEKNTFIKGQIVEISKLNPSIKTIDDLANVDRYEELVKKVESGYSMVDAYKLTYFDEIKNNAFETAKKQATANINNKLHLKTNNGGGSKEIKVPADIMAIYKKNMPNKTEAEIRKIHAKMIGEN